MERPSEEDFNETLNYVGKCMIMWSMEHTKNPEKCKEHSDDISESFICQVLNKRMKAFNTGIIIPDYLSLMIELCTNSNPGQSLMILAEILEKLPKPVADGYVITPEDFIRVYTNKFPIVWWYEDINDRLNKRWNEQKVVPAHPLQTDNACGEPEYWNKLLGR